MDCDKEPQPHPSHPRVIPCAKLYSAARANLANFDSDARAKRQRRNPLSSPPPRTRPRTPCHRQGQQIPPGIPPPVRNDNTLGVAAQNRSVTRHTRNVQPVQNSTSATSSSDARASRPLLLWIPTPERSLTRFCHSDARAKRDRRNLLSPPSPRTPPPCPPPTPQKSLATPPPQV